VALGAGFDLATITATTFEKIKKDIIDNVSNHMALFFWLNDKGQIDYESGGYQIRQPLMYGLNETIKSYTPGDHFSTQRPNGFTSTYWDWAFVGGSITIDGPTKFMNSGENAIVSLVEQYIEQLQISYAQAMSTMWFSDGTGNGGKDLLGLDLLVETGSGSWNSVGGIDSDAYTWWRNYYYDNSSCSGGWGTGGNCCGIIALRTALRNTNKMGGQADLFLTSGLQYDLYEAAIADKMVANYPQYTNEKYADAGFGGIRYKNVDILWDENYTGNDWFILNSKALRFVVGQGADFTVDKAMPHPTMDAEIMKSKMYGQLVIRHRRDSLGRVTQPAVT